MEGNITLYEKILSERRRLESQINHLETRLKNYPTGKLICSRNGNRYKWYLSDGHKKTYIPKSNRRLAEQLAEKKYLTSLREDLVNEKRALEFYLRHHETDVGKTESLLTQPSEYRNLLNSSFIPLSQELFDWMKCPYQQNPLYPEQLIHNSSSGNRVRSKTEAIIDMFLHIHKIPFRYECALQLGEVVTYPDFTIRHPKTGETYYWEHFGMMDNLSYSKHVGSKLQHYISYGIIPNIQLITTYETKEKPLSAGDVQALVEHYFL